MITQDDISGLAEETDYVLEPNSATYGSLAEFIKTFKASLDPRLWVNLVQEELDELYAEKPRTPEHLKELADLLYVYIGLELTTTNSLGALIPEDEATKTLKLLGRADRALKEYFLFYGEDIVSEAFRRVHKSNMSKLDENGNPIFREDGKVMKGPNYKKPDLTDLV